MKVAQLLAILIAFCSLWQAPVQAGAPRYTVSFYGCTDPDTWPERLHGRNSSGQTVYNLITGGKSRAGVKNHDGTTFLLDQLPDTKNSHSVDINDYGVVIGDTDFVYSPLRRTATVWTPGLAPIDMTPEPYIKWSTAEYVNNRGDVTVNVEDELRHDFGYIWHDGVLYKIDDCLDTPNVHVEEVGLITNAGIILGKGRLNGYPCFNFKLTPSGSHAIPEPSTMFLLVTGVGIAGFKRIKK